MSPATKKSAKKTAAKKAAPKTAASKQGAPKKAAVKKSAAKKPAPKKAASKRASKKKEEALLGKADIDKALKKIKAAVRKDFPDPRGLLILGIRTRGVTLADRLRDLLEKDYGTRLPLGVIDITLYRDDLSTLGPQPMVRDSEIPFDITGANIVLVDDVLFTGRTIRAALDEITDFGRPQHVRLAVLVDRGGREYPIQADYVGKSIQVEVDEFVRVHLDEVDEKEEVIAMTGKKK